MNKVDINDAIKKGLEKGINQNNIETDKKMKLKDININDIMDITGLTKEEIEKL